MRVVVAPDSFKSTMSARVAAGSIARGWLAERPGDEVLLRPMADGGEGTLDAFAAVEGAVVEWAEVVDPVGRPRTARWVRLPDGSAVVELAECCGMLLLEEPAPRMAHTVGFGMAIRAALDSGASRLLLAVGGSASTDCGAGLLVGLGARLLDDDGAEIREPGNGALLRISEVDLSGLPPLPSGGAVVLSDVTNPLLGPDGAAAVFGPQKDGVPGELEPGVAYFASLLGGDPSAPGAGAAGGAGFALQRWGAVTVSGARAVAEAIGLPESVVGADLVITGEGRFDAQTASGKVVQVVRELAGDARTALVAGRIDADVSGLAGAVSLWELAGERALARPEDAAVDAGRRLATLAAGFGSQGRDT